MPFLTRDAVVAVKIESTVGTDSVPTVSNAMLVYECDMKPLSKASTYPRKPVGAGLANLPSVPGVKAGEFTCTVMLTGSGATGPTTPPPYDVLLRACGMTKTTSGGPPVTTHTYKFTKPTETVSIYMWRLKGTSSLLTKLIGCMRSFEITMNNGEPAMAKFTMTGVYKSPVDDAAPPDPTFTDIDPIPVGDALFTFQGFSPICEAVNINFNNNVILRPSINKSDKTGFISAMITDRNPEMTFAMETEHVADFDAYGYWEDQTSGAVNIGPMGPANGNKFQITVPNATVDGQPDNTDSNGLQRLNIKSIPSSDLASSNNEVSLIFT